MLTDTAGARDIRSERISLRATPHQRDMLRRAAEATDHTVTEFILESAVGQAERVLADRRWFLASGEQFDEFARLLDEPLASTQKFRKLFTRPSSHSGA